MLEFILRRQFLKPELMTLRRVPDLRIEPVGAMWAAFSPLSGQTSLLSDWSAAVLEVLEQGPLSEEGLFLALSSDSGTTVDQVEMMVHPAIRDLTEAGLIRSCPT